MSILRTLIAAALVCGVAFPAGAASGPSWTLRAHGAIVDSKGGSHASFDNGFTSSVDGGGGFGFGVEYLVSERFGVELSTLFAGLDVGMKASANRTSSRSYGLSVTPVTVGLPIHLGSGERLDLFVAPTLSVVSYTDFEASLGPLGAQSSVNVGSDVGPGVALGLDAPIGEGKWAFSTGLRYIETEAEQVDVDPLILTIGLAYRFGARAPATIASSSGKE